MAITRTKCFSLLASALIGLTSAAFAQDSGPLLDLLVKKGVINDQEAENLRAELVKDFAANTSAGKLNLASTLTELRLSGDVRARFESRTGELPSGDHQERDRFRYRFRTSLTGKLVNDWSFGVRLETASGSRSSNVTMGDDSAANTSPFHKASDGLYVGQVYLTYTPSPLFNVTVGRMPNPLNTTLMVWDGDINPEGLAEQFKYRDGNNEFSATLGQFLYSSGDKQNIFGATSATNPSKDMGLLAWQGGYKLYLEGATKYFLVTPTLYTYVRSSQNAAAFRDNFSATANQTAVNNLTVVEIPAEFDWLLGGVPARAYADVAINLDGKARAKKFGNPELDNQNKAYTVGFQYGKAANKGEWDARIFYQSVQAFALDPNLVDSDIFDSRTNMQGIVVGGDYALGGATMLTVTASQAKRVNNTIIAPGAGDIGSNNALDKYWLLQADVVVKF
jgi:polyhydroxyalkanoate synthesis regulator phasin